MISDSPKIPIEDVINRIEHLNEGMSKFWANSHGWAPIDAAGLLSKSRLDWQVSFSGALRLWIRNPATALTPAELILAWATLGTLIEGTIKTLLSVWYETYRTDIINLKKVQAFDHKKHAAYAPEGLTLEPLRRYCKEQNLLDAAALQMIELVQQRRNAIHAFKDRAIGNDIEFQEAVRGYLDLLRQVNERLPYPDGVYQPGEV
jgi:hypothetical protein